MDDLLLLPVLLSYQPPHYYHLARQSVLILLVHLNNLLFQVSSGSVKALSCSIALPRLSIISVFLLNKSGEQGSVDFK